LPKPAEKSGRNSTSEAVLETETNETSENSRAKHPSDEATTRDDLTTLEEHIRIDEVVEVEVINTDDPRPTFRTVMQRNLSSTDQTRLRAGDLTR